jgi:hypothetical protein
MAAGPLLAAGLAPPIRPFPIDYASYVNNVNIPTLDKTNTKSNNEKTEKRVAIPKARFFFGCRQPKVPVDLPMDYPHQPKVPVDLPAQDYSFHDTCE